MDKMAEIPTKVKSKKLVLKRRNQIVLGAIKLFSRKGFHKTTLRELAKEAGISHGNMYEYISNKEDIFFLVHDFMHRIAQEIIRQSIDGIEDPVEKLRRLVRGEFNIIHLWADAILLIYQETHILGKPLLYTLLEKERTHVRKIEEVLEECIQKGKIRGLNVRVAANLIRGMVETWVVKRWDLRRQINRMEMETTLLDLLFNGLLNRGENASMNREPLSPLHGKTAFFINSGTCLGDAVISFLLSKGARVIAYEKKVFENEQPLMKPDRCDDIKIYTSKDHGEMTPELLKKIMDDNRSINLVIHDLGINVTRSISNAEKSRGAKDLEANLRCAEDLSHVIETEFSRKGSGTLLYIAPWGWDRYADSFRYEMVKKGIVALNQVMAKRVAPAKINVNCLIPGFIGGIKPSSIEKEKITQVMEKIPMGAMGEISDVLEAVQFLVSDSSKYVTGQVLEVAGGLT